LPGLALGAGAGERLADRGGWVSEVVDAFAGLDVVEEFLVAHGEHRIAARVSGRRSGRARGGWSMRACAAARRRTASATACGDGSQQFAPGNIG